MGDVIAGIDFRSGYAKKSWQNEVADERRKEADRLASKSAVTDDSKPALTDDQIKFADEIAGERRQAWARLIGQFDTAPSEYCVPPDEPA